MRVVVDLNRCEANAICTSIAPEVFELDDDDRLHVLAERPGPELRERAREAARQCPRQAIDIDEES